MEISIIAGIIASVVLLVWLSKKLNSHSFEKYGYRPIGLGTIILGMIPYILVIVGLFLKDTNLDNLQMAIVFAGLSELSLFGWIAYRSSWKVALGALIILLLVGLPALLVLIFSDNRDDYYYYD